MSLLIFLRDHLFIPPQYMSQINNIPCSSFLAARCNPDSPTCMPLMNFTTPDASPTYFIHLRYALHFGLVCRSSSVCDNLRHTTLKKQESNWLKQSGRCNMDTIVMGPPQIYWCYLLHPTINLEILFVY